MEKTLKFNSQVCTNRFQSQRLLALGLKKETADMIHSLKQTAHIGDWFILPIYHGDNRYCKECIPAWSLHRLWCLLPCYITIVTHDEYGRRYKVVLDLNMDTYQHVCYFEGVDEPYYDRVFCGNDAYESICKAIEWLIKEGYFNKEYLNETTEN